MPRVNPKIKWKKRYNRCAICGETNYNILEVHRIIYGEHGGEYVLNNILVVCRNDHRRIHCGEIEITKKAKSMSGEIVIYIEDGIEKIKNI